MSGSSEQITSPDQRKPLNRKGARIGAIACAIVCVLMMIGNHEGHVEDVFLGVTAALLVLAIVLDWLLRKNGLRR